MSRRPSLRFAAALLVALLAGPAAALILVTGDGSGNVEPPPQDPGWARFGTKSPCPPQCGLTYLYLGEGWVLTARHVTAQEVRFFASGTLHAPVPGSEVAIGGKRSRVDLLLFRIQNPPPLPLLEISRKRPAPGTPVLMVAGGQTRGDPLPGSPSPGWSPRLPGALRWGTNRVAKARISLPYQAAETLVFATRFDRPGTPAATRHEAHAVAGDSGGGVFVVGESGWELAGILISASPAVYGVGHSIAADLSHYRDEILERVTDRGTR